ncbi:hypothetical protein BKA70DRAFT_1279757 [Coprinopsis sp. MPI-PUGE-AT-0042]|nr:hypothetical protein BKA70DRAFT_1279757 [Coprinopsis sp. MPI-PUGE-AT-0042]
MHKKVTFTNADRRVSPSETGQSPQAAGARPDAVLAESYSQESTHPQINESPGSKARVTFAVEDDTWTADSEESSAPASAYGSEASSPRESPLSLPTQTNVTSSECRNVTDSAAPPNPNLAVALLVPQRQQTRLFHYDLAWPAIPRQTLTSTILSLPARSAPLSKMFVELIIPYGQGTGHIVNIEGPSTQEGRRSPLMVQNVLQALYIYLQQPCLDIDTLPSSEKARLRSVAAQRRKQTSKYKVQQSSEVLLVDLLGEHRAFYGLQWKHYQGSIPVYTLVLGD